MSGVQRGTYFTQLGWVIETIHEQMGWRPYPGTFNIRVVEEDQPLLVQMCAEKDFDLISPQAQFCNAGAKRVDVNGLPGIAVFPSDDVRCHGQQIVEIIAPCSLRERLGINTGDLVQISWLNPGKGEGKE